MMPDLFNPTSGKLLKFKNHMIVNAMYSLLHLEFEPKLYIRCSNYLASRDNPSIHSTSPLRSPCLRANLWLCHFKKILASCLLQSPLAVRPLRRSSSWRGGPLALVW